MIAKIDPKIWTFIINSFKKQNLPSKTSSNKINPSKIIMKTTNNTHSKTHIIIKLMKNCQIQKIHNLCIIEETINIHKTIRIVCTNQVKMSQIKRIDNSLIDTQ